MFNLTDIETAPFNDLLALSSYISSRIRYYGPEQPHGNLEELEKQLSIVTLEIAARQEPLTDTLS